MAVIDWVDRAVRARVRQLVPTVCPPFLVEKRSPSATHPVGHDDALQVSEVKVRVQDYP